MLWTQIGLFMVAAICSLIFTHRPVVITGESMRPVLDRGDVVIFDTPDLATLRVGQVIMFDLGDGNVTHRITGFHDDRTLITRGDANAITDTSPVPLDHITGRARVIVPFVGLPMIWTQDGSWLKLATWGFATTAAVVLLLVSPQRQEQRQRRQRWLDSRRRKRAQRRQPSRTPQPATARPPTAPVHVTTTPQGQPTARPAARSTTCVPPGSSTLRPRAARPRSGVRPTWPAPHGPSRSPWRPPRSLPAPLRTSGPTAPPKSPAPLPAPQVPSQK